LGYQLKTKEDKIMSALSQFFNTSVINRIQRGFTTAQSNEPVVFWTDPAPAGNPGITTVSLTAVDGNKTFYDRYIYPNTTTRNAGPGAASVPSSLEGNGTVTFTPTSVTITTGSGLPGRTGWPSPPSPTGNYPALYNSISVEWQVIEYK
jgi:hypothetical protein